jgi:hypothetical protein
MITKTFLLPKTFRAYSMRTLRVTKSLRDHESSRCPQSGTFTAKSRPRCKNQVRLDVQAGGGRRGRGQPQEVCWSRVLAAVDWLAAAGATVIREDIQNGVTDHFVMADFLTAPQGETSPAWPSPA